MAQTTASQAALLTLALALLSSPAGAASLQAPVRASDLGPEVFAGYSFTEAGDANLNGWTLGVTAPWHRLQLVADLNGHWGSFAGADLGQLGIFAGVRQTWRFAGIQPFAEALVGGVRRTTKVAVADDVSLEESASRWGAAFGGGAGYGFASRWSVRALAHLRLLRGGGVWDQDLRFAAGVAYRFGR